jgi:hypothetical protein
MCHGENYHFVTSPSEFDAEVMDLLCAGFVARQVAIDEDQYAHGKTFTL